jgi:hypothetical protein
VAPEAVSTTVCPLVISAAAGLIVTVGNAFTITAAIALLAVTAQFDTCTTALK